MARRRLVAAFSMALVLLAGASLAQQSSGISGRGVFVVDSRWNDGPFTQVDAGPTNTIALRADGTCNIWGNNSLMQCANPWPLPSGVSYVEVATSAYSILARRSDGKLDAWGMYSYTPPPLPTGSWYQLISAQAPGTGSHSAAAACSSPGATTRRANARCRSHPSGTGSSASTRVSVTASR